MLLSVIVPMLNEEEVCAITFNRLEEVLANVEHELIFIDDGSTDKTLEILKNCIGTNSPHQIVSFSRNFGHQAAFSAGLTHARGQAVVIIDGDLQDPPELIHQMLDKWREGWQVVYAQRRQRAGETFFKLITAKMFYRLLHELTTVTIPKDTGDYRLMDRAVVDALVALPERSRFLRGLVPWVGFKQTGLQYDRAERFAGTTKYPLKKMLRLALDGITSFSTLPLKFSFVLGLGATALAIIMALWAAVTKVIDPGSTSPGWASLVVAITFMGGVQLITLGIIGEYIGRIYEEVKQRPLFIIREKVGPQ
jgi:glycosyltransferase involved in cell wall biosynthesis